MTVQELIEELEKYPPEYRVVFRNVEFGFLDIREIKKSPIVLDVYGKYGMSGPHEEKSYYEHVKTEWRLPPIENTGGIIDAVLLMDYKDK